MFRQTWNYSWSVQAHKKRHTQYIDRHLWPRKPKQKSSNKKKNTKQPTARRNKRNATAPEEKMTRRRERKKNEINVIWLKIITSEAEKENLFSSLSYASCPKTEQEIANKTNARQKKKRAQKQKLNKHIHIRCVPILTIRFFHAIQICAYRHETMYLSYHRNRPKICNYSYLFFFSIGVCFFRYLFSSLHHLLAVCVCVVTWLQSILKLSTERM